jgi:IS30 family transposase
VLKRELTAHLRRGRSTRRSRGRTPTARPGAILEGLAIAERPPAVAARAVPDHRESDLLAGARNSHLATLVERASRFVVLVRVPGKDSGRVVDALIAAAHRLPAGLMTALTWDRGAELAQHRRFTVRRTSRSTAATRGDRGSAGRTRTPTGSSGSTSRRGGT